MAVENDCNIFLDLMRCEVKGQPYWLDRDLQKAFGYSSFQKFSAIVNKAKKDIEAEGLDMNNHFNQLDKMQEIGSGAKRRIVVTMLSGHACLHIAELADKRKESVQLARSFFSNNDFTLKGEHCKYLTLAIDKDKRDIQRRNILYWKRLTDHASEFYIAKMKKLDGVRSVKRDDTFHGHKAPFHMMYKLKTIIHEGRGYEFLIEYKIDEPTVGIYYGVKGLIMDGDDDHQINEFNKEWETLEGTVTYYLNAVFPGKDFSVRYKPTNNANDHTYWPFWITLYEDEDIIKVGLRALKIISKIYQEYFKNGGKNLISYKPDKDTKASSQIETVTAFTEDAYHALETKIPSAMLKKFIDTLTDSRILSKDKVFERAYVFVLYERQMDQQEIALLFREFYRQVKGMFEDDNRINTPWEALTKVFLDKDLMPFKADNLKNLCTNIVQQYRKNRFKKGKAGTSISSAIKCYEDVKEILSPIFK